MKLRLIVGTACLLLAAMSATAGGSVVWFVDGRTLVVESIEIDGEIATIALIGGSQISVPASRIERHHGQPAVVATPAAAAVAVRSEDWTHLAGPYAETIRAAALRHGLDPILLTALAEAESGFDPRAVSHKGAEGLLQLMPATARRFGVSNSFDASQNVEGGAQYLKWLLERFSGDEELALAGYNAGEGAVARYQGVPPFPETRTYVGRVLDRARTLRSGVLIAR